MSIKTGIESVENANSGQQGDIAERRLAMVTRLLLAAIDRRDVTAARTALAAGADANACDDNAISALNHAIAHGMPELVQSLLEHGASAMPSARHCPLVIAVKRGYGPIVKMLLAAGAPPDAWDGHEHVVHSAAELGFAHIVQLLSDTGASPDQCLVAAATRGDASEVARLLRQGAISKIEDALTAAVRGRFAAIIEMLLEHDVRGDLALDEAARQGYVEGMRLLIKVGLGIPTIAMHAAVEGGHSEAVRLLLQVAGSECLTGHMLFAAVDQDAVEIVELLLQHGVDPEQDCEQGHYTILSNAAGNGKVEVVRRLAQAGAQADRCSWSDELIPAGMTALMCAAAESFFPLQGCADLRRDSIDPLARVQAAKARKRRPVFGKDFAACGEILLAAGADANAALADGTTPLLWAAYNGNRRLVAALLHHGADANARADNGATPLMWAVDRADAKMACALLAAGADPALQHVLSADVLVQESRDVDRLQRLLEDAPNRRLLRAAENGDLAEVERQLAAGADANAMRSNGTTPLIGAVQPLCEEAGMHISFAKVEDAITHDKARQKNHVARDEILRQLLAAGADVGRVPESMRYMLPTLCVHSIGSRVV